MRTMLIAHALLLMSDPDNAGGIPAESNPNTNDAGAAPAPETATGGFDQVESEDAFAARLEAERAEAARIRELTPIQEVELRPLVGASHLGVIIGSGEPGGGYRCIPLADWRTDRLALRAGDTCQIVVLAGEGQKQWDFYVEQERRSKERPALGDVKTVSLSPAAAAAILGAQAGNLQPGAASSPAVDPLEDTQPVETIPPAGETKAPEAETTTAQA